MLLEEEFIEHLDLGDGTGLEARLARRRRRRAGLLAGAHTLAAEKPDRLTGLRVDPALLPAVPDQDLLAVRINGSGGVVGILPGLLS